MHITTMTMVSAFFSLFIPGLGHLIHGKVLWAAFWFFVAVFFTPATVFFAALHCFFLD